MQSLLVTKVRMVLDDLYCSLRHAGVQFGAGGSMQPMLVTQVHMVHDDSYCS